MKLTLATLCLILSVFSFAVVAGYVAVKKKPSPISAWLLAAFLLAMTATLGNFILFSSSAVLERPGLAFVGNTIGLSAAPLLFLYATSLADESFKLRPGTLWRFAPVAVFLGIVFSAYTFMPRAEKIAILKDPTHASLINEPLLQVSIFAFVVFYLATTIRLLHKHQVRFATAQAAPGGRDLGWLQIAVVGAAGVWTGSLLHQLVVAIWPAPWIDAMFTNLLALSAFALGFYFLIHALRQKDGAPSPRAAQPDETEKYGNHRLSDEQVHAFAQTLETYLAVSNAYLESGLTLSDLAEALPMTARELSQTLNRHYRKSFHEFINDRRIARAAERLGAEPDASITSIMAETGFVSKSSFYSEFRKRLGKTPSAYRRAAP